MTSERDDVFFEDAYIPTNVKQFLKVGRMEEKMSTNFNMAVSGMGLGKDTKWGKAAIYMFGIWTIATSFVCFEKPDFLNVSTDLV
jgi:hypothetical protein